MKIFFFFISFFIHLLIYFLLLFFISFSHTSLFDTVIHLVHPLCQLKIVQSQYINITKFVGCYFWSLSTLSIQIFIKVSIDIPNKIEATLEAILSIAHCYRQSNIQRSDWSIVTANNERWHLKSYITTISNRNNYYI